jgi:hypothetical protein
MADDLTVNAADWNGLSSDDQEKVKNILTATGLLKSGSNITADPNTASLAAVGAADPQLAGFINFCKIGCDLAQAAATAACAGLPGPAAALCIAAAKAGGDFCRSKC